MIGCDSATVADTKDLLLISDVLLVLTSTLVAVVPVAVTVAAIVDDGFVVSKVKLLNTEAVGVCCFVIAAVVCVIFSCASLIILS